MARARALVRPDASLGRRGKTRRVVKPVNQFFEFTSNLTLDKNLTIILQRNFLSCVITYWYEEELISGARATERDFNDREACDEKFYEGHSCGAGDGCAGGNRRIRRGQGQSQKRNRDILGRCDGERHARQS